MTGVKNGASLKGKVKNIAKEKNIPAQAVLQNYLLERILERISQSTYRRNFVLKGGYLISAMIGIDSRTTMDIDATIIHYPVNADTITAMFQSIIHIPISDSIDFVFNGVTEIRETDEYQGFRVHLTAYYPPLCVPLKLDITTGDEITPHEIEYSYPMMFEDKKISIYSYNLETVLAEKLESILSRGVLNTRIRDYYDLFTLQRIKNNDINYDTLKSAVTATAKKRGTTQQLKKYISTIKDCANSATMNKLWQAYQSEFEYARGISFEDCCNSVETIMIRIQDATQKDSK